MKPWSGRTQISSFSRDNSINSKFGMAWRGLAGEARHGMARRGGHDIPCDDVIRRFASRWEAVAKVLPYRNKAEFYDTTTASHWLRNTETESCVPSAPGFPGGWRSFMSI